MRGIIYIRWGSDAYDVGHQQELVQIMVSEYGGICRLDASPPYVIVPEQAEMTARKRLEEILKMRFDR